MYRVHLSEEQHEELRRLTRDPDAKPRTRDRLEMVRLAAAGMSIPRIARFLRLSEVRVRFWIKQFLTQGFAGLPDQPHVGQTSQLTPELLGALRQEVGKGDRTWTAGQLAAWLEAQHGLRLHPQHLGTLLKRAGFAYRRTERRLKHKQDPEQVAQKRAELQKLEKGALPGAWTWRT